MHSKVHGKDCDQVEAGISFIDAGEIPMFAYPSIDVDIASSLLLLLPSLRSMVWIGCFAYYKITTSESVKQVSDCPVR